MRQGQHNKRARGRGRKPQNPANRTYDSNGPDVKIRGTAAHIAEKYQSLARDAQVSGDPISAENYMQHAEHYSRIIAAAQAQMQSQQAAQENSGHGTNGAGRPDQNEQNKSQPQQQAEESDDKPEKTASAQSGEDSSGGDDEGRAKRPRGRRRPKVVSVDGAQADGAGSGDGATQASAPVSEAGNNNSGDGASSSDGPVIAEAG